MKLVRLPLVYRTKRPALADWQKLSPAELADWCEQAKASGQPHNWGVRLDGLVVVDCDTPEAVKRWEAEAPVVSVYQSRGNPDRRAYWYQLPPKAVVRAGKMWNGEVDIKTGPGHQMVVPDSVHPDGHQYAWCGRGGDPGDWTVMSLPAAPVEMLVSQLAVAGWEGPEQDGIQEGCRDTTLAAVGGVLRRYAGLNEDALIRVLTAVDAVGCHPPVGNAAVNRIARSIAQYAAGLVFVDEDGEIVEEDEL